MSEQKFQFTIDSSDLEQFKRLDQFLTSKIIKSSRSFIKLLFEEGHITATVQRGKKIELKKMPATGTIIEVIIPAPRKTETKAENIPLEIIFEDEHLMFINKSAGIVTHPAPGNYEGTLVNAILYHCKDLKGIGNELRPGIVHRLDKGTSGVMVVAKSNECLEKLVNLFSTHNIERRYEALVLGDKFPSGGTLESTIGRHPKNRLKMTANLKNGKNAITHYKVLENFEKLSLFELKLETGRTHQIRVHINQLLHSSILCDPLYGNPKEHLQRIGPEFKKIIEGYPHPFLHAKILGLKHPISGEDLFFEVPPPPIWNDLLIALRGQT